MRADGVELIAAVARATVVHVVPAPSAVPFAVPSAAISSAVSSVPSAPSSVPPASSPVMPAAGGPGGGPPRVAVSTPIERTSGFESYESSQVVQALVRCVVAAGTGYSIDYSALPLLIAKRSTAADQRRYLANHAEKKVLAEAIVAIATAGGDIGSGGGGGSGSGGGGGNKAASPSPSPPRSPPLAPLRIEVSLKMCSDCHVLFQHAAPMLRRAIMVEDIATTHHFSSSSPSCSCGSPAIA